MSDLQDQILQEVPGASDVITWFGYWPSFHDAEVISLLLNREQEAVLKVHYFKVSRKVTPGSQLAMENHAIVSFSLTNILAMELSDFNHQNVLSGLTLSKTMDGFLLELGCCYGLCGSIRAESIRISLAPGMPHGSVYALVVDA